MSMTMRSPELVMVCYSYPEQKQREESGARMKSNFEVWKDTFY